MELKVTHEPGYVLGKVVGTIDDSAAPLFREYLHPLVAQRGTKLIVDLSAADRITSIGISNLVLLVTDANTNSSHVVLASPPPFVSMVLNVTKLDRFFDVADTVPQAIERACGSER
jgi:anti-anti-sigma factor